MNDPKHLHTWNVYQSAWRAIGDDERTKLLRESVSPDVVYTDPGSQTSGVDELTARIADSQRQFPGSSFVNDDFLEHHDQGLFWWKMFDGNEAEFVKGYSFGRFGNDGRLIQATGFFAAPPA